MIKKHIKQIRYVLGGIVALAGALWLLPTLFVKTGYLTVIDFAENGVSEDGNFINYTVTYQYDRDGEKDTGTYEIGLAEGVTPTIGEQDIMYYSTIWPYTADYGGAPSPVPPLIVIAVGGLIAFCPPLKFLKRK